MPDSRLLRAKQSAAMARGQWPGAQPPEKILTGFYAKQIGYQYRRFNAVDNTL